jgi:two-component system sensor histidine kinase KdpD
MTRQSRSWKDRLAGYGLSVLLLAPVTVGLWLVRDALTLANFSLIYILLILVIAVWLGLGPALLAAVGSFFSFNFFLIRPYYTLAVEDPRELIDLVIFLVVAGVASQVAAYARRQATTARQRADEQQILYQVSSTLNRLTRAEEIYGALEQVLQQSLQAREVALLPDVVGTPIRGARPDGATTYLLLEVPERVYGTLRVTFAAPPSESQSRLLMAGAVQAAMALQRIELSEWAQKSRTLEEADRLKTTLLRAVSHDLRTPITIVKSSASNLHTLDDRLSPAEKLEMVQVIEEEIDHLDRLVGDLLDMSRLQAGALVLHRRWNGLSEIVGDVAARIWQLSQSERVRLALPDEMPAVYCDYALLVRALSNIAENAVRYEPAGSQVVLKGCVADGEQGEREARIIVENHGPTIPAEERSRVLEPFYQGQIDGGAAGGSHVGLGLAIARGIVEAHEGRLWVEDTPGGGATFVVALPLDGREPAGDAAAHR